MVETLRAQIVELTARLGQNSQNSSRPPASDSPFVKPAPKSLRRQSGRKPGGQPGHPGSTLALVANPNERLRHEPGPCSGCGADLAGAPEVCVERRQVFDLPPMTVRVTEHQLIARRCCCRATTCGAAPEGVTAPVQYGPRITAIILYLYVGQFLSKKRTAAALAELFGTPVSEGTVATMTKRAADGLDEFLGQLSDRLSEAEVAGFDETGLRVAGKLHWVHCARTDKYTLITCHAEGLRLPAHPHRSQTVLRHPQLPIHRRQIRQTLPRSPRHAHRGPTLAPRNELTSARRRDQLLFKLLSSLSPDSRLGWAPGSTSPG